MENVEDYTAALDMGKFDYLKVTIPVLRDTIMTDMIVSPAMNGQVGEYEISEVLEIVSMAKEAIRSGRLIDFGHWTNASIIEGGHRGGPMYGQRALAHPFTKPWMFVHTWEQPTEDIPEGLANALKGQPQSSGYLVNPLPDTNGAVGCDVEVVTFEGVKYGGDRNVMLVGDRGLLIPGHDGNFDKYHCQMIPMALRFQNGVKPSDRFADPRVDQIYTMAAANVFDPLMLALLILNTKGIKSETIAVKDSLNKSRKLAGKHLIYPYRRVFSDPYVTAIRGARAPGPVGPGHHASPKPHIRRGHWREYKPGERSFVRDTLVMATEEMRKQFVSSRTHYVIKKETDG